MYRLVPLVACSLLLGCGPYDGAGPRAQHQDGTVSQVTLEGEVVTAGDREAEERAERLRKEQERQDRERARQEAEEARVAEEKAADEAVEGEVVAEAETPADEPAPEEPTASSAEGAVVADSAAAAEAVPPLAETRPEVEGNLAALIAEEERLAAANAASAVGEGAEEPASSEEGGGTGSPLASESAAGAEDTTTGPEGSGPLAAIEPTSGADAEAPAVELPSGDDLPPTLTAESLPPCDPNDLAAMPLRDLSLKQTFGEGETARAVLASTGGSEFVVAKGSVVGPDGARVVRVSPGELILAEIQFDMTGAPVMVQKALRMDIPR